MPRHLLLSALAIATLLIGCAWLLFLRGPGLAAPERSDETRAAAPMNAEAPDELLDRFSPVSVSEGSLGDGHSRIEGTIRRTGGSGAPGARVTLHRCSLPEDLLEAEQILLSRILVEEETERRDGDAKTGGLLPSIANSLEALAETIAEEGGAYRFDGVGAGTYLVTAQTPTTAHSPATELLVVREAPTGSGPIDVTLVEASTLHGTVLGEDGSPIPQARLRLLTDLLPDEREPLIPRDFLLLALLHPREIVAEVDAEGRFEIPGLPPLDFQVVVRAEDWATAVLPQALPTEEPLIVILAGGGMVVGAVNDAEGRPLEGVEVSLEIFGSAEDPSLRLVEPSVEVSGADGSFRFLGLGSASVSLTARAPGWQEARIPTLIVEQGGVHEVAMLLEPGAVIEGRVVDESGTGLAGIEVTATAQGGGRRGRVRETTDEEGGFRFDTLPFQRHQLTARAPEWQEATLEAGAASPGEEEPVELVLLPGASVRGRVVDAEGSPLRSAVVEHRGEKHGVDGEGRFSFRTTGPVEELVLAVRCRGFQEVILEIPAEGIDLGDVLLEPSPALRGLVLGPDGEPLSGASITATSRETLVIGERRGRNRRSSAWSGGDGRFRLEVDAPDQEHTLVARCPGLRPSPPLKVVPSSRGSEELVLSLSWGAGVTGVVRGPTRQPVDRASVELRSTGQWRRSNTVGKTRTGPDGRFELTGYGAGDYQLRVRAAGLGGSSLSLSLGEEELRRVEVALEEELLLTGVVVDPDRQPVAGARFQTWQEGSAWRATTTDPNGVFVVDQLSPGPVRVRVQASGFRSLDVEDIFPGEGAVVIELEVAHSLEGVVLDATTGAPIRRARLRAQRSDEDGGSGHWTRSDAEGRFSFEALREGKYTLRADAEGYLPFRSDELRVPSPSEGSELLITLRAGGRIRGRVYDAFGRELSGAEVSARRIEEDGSVSTRGRPDARARTDEAGEFSLVGLEERRYQVTIDHPEHHYARREALIDFEAAEPWLSVHLAAGGVVEGRVILPGGAPPTEGVIRLRGPSSGPHEGMGTTRRSSREQDAGRFRFAGLPGGVYLLSYHPEGRGPALALVEVELPPDGLRVIDLHVAP
ncbi:MAG: carboxypeptidase regulatory-like domain-containing protein [Planctomycetota bacterium]